MKIFDKKLLLLDQILRTISWGQDRGLLILLFGLGIYFFPRPWRF